MGAISRFWILTGLVPPIPTRGWVVRARVRRCQLLLEHFRNVIVVFYDLNQLCNVFLERVRGWGAFDFSGHSDGEPQNKKSLDVSFADVVACFSSERSELPNIFVYVIPF